MAEIRIQNVWKTFGKVVAVKDVTLTVEDREFVILLGPSGCGKTTLLRCISGLEQVDRGTISIGGRDVTNLPPRRRGIAMVFQSYAVFPHMTVFDNIAFGLRMKKLPKDEIERRVRDAAALMHIEDLLDRYPAQLSGGQRQRVAVARAIAVQSEVLLMDEPLSNLDALLRLEMRAELKRLFTELETTVVYVTHDQVEAMSMGDRIAVMREGEILQFDTPVRVYDYPADRFIGGFIGNPPMNFLVADVEDGRVVVHGTPIEVPPLVLEHLKPPRTLVGIRAENIELFTEQQEGAIPVQVLVVEPLGSHNLVTARADGDIIKVNTPADLRLAPDQRVWIRFVPEKIRWFDAQTGKALPVDYQAVEAARVG